MSPSLDQVGQAFLRAAYEPDAWPAALAGLAELTNSRGARIGEVVLQHTQLSSLPSGWLLTG